jgi:methionyl-tRNA formyltransferase
MGTPQFSVPSLVALHEKKVDIVLVITQPDRGRGRGRKVIPSPIKKTAESLGFDIIQPTSIREEWVTDRIRSLEPHIIVVVAFGQILPKTLLQIPREGAINLHASLLPKYRGPAPIQWAIINGETETGVTTMLMDEKMDTGDILLSKKTDIGPEDNSETLHDRLANIGADLLVKTLHGMERNEIQPLPQDHSQATYAPMLKKSDGRIDWNLSAKKIEDFIRGMTPWPGAFTFLENKRLKIFKARAVPSESSEEPGKVISGFPDELRIATGKDSLSILELQSESGKRLPITEFLRGFKVSL